MTSDVEYEHMKATQPTSQSKNSSFLLGMVAAVAMILLATYAALGGAPGHPIYALCLGIFGLIGGAATMAEHSGLRVFRDAYLVMFGLVIGIMLTPKLLRLLGG